MAKLTNRRIASLTGKSAGFTLIEIIIAIVVVGLLTAIALPTYNNAVTNARNKVVLGDLNRIDAALQRTRGNGALPANLAAIGMDGLRDPWGHAYQYLNIEVGVNRGAVRKDRNLVPLNTDFDLYSMGKDGASKPPLTAAASRDDLLRAGNGGFVGKAEDF
jgi:general secretion pathway protein G